MRKKELPGELRKKNQRLAHSRDELKERNRQRALEVKYFMGKVADIDESRSEWRKKYKELASKCEALESELLSSKQALCAEQNTSELLREEIEAIKKKLRFRGVDS